MSRYILAVHAGHNASALIGDETGVIYAVQEERLNGEKNYWGLPRLSVRACLEKVHAHPRDLATVTCGMKQVMYRYHSREDVLNAYRRQLTVSGKIRQRVLMPLLIATRPNYGQAELREFIDQELTRDVPVTHHDHHLSHGTTAYFGLRRDPERPYLVLTCDGAGDGYCASVRVMRGGRIETIAETPWESSLGSIYSWVTFIMGFVPLEHEYKLMGMAPYASESAAKEAAAVFESYLGLDGLELKRKTSERTNDLSDRMFADLRGMRFDYICAGLQKFTEDLLVEWAQRAVEKTGVRDLVAGGGVFMNVKANKRIAELPNVDSFEAFPSCGDETLPFGAFYLEALRRFGNDKVRGLRHFYLGDEESDADVLASVREAGFPYEHPRDMAAAVVDLLAGGKPVARCAGAMEFGARALGNRSILADPKNSDVVRIINQMVKKRDFWMPFAPMLLEDKQDAYLHNPKRLASPYMMMTFDTKENFRDMIAAVHNADLTCRAQLLRPEQNPEMAAILRAFEARTGRPVLLNTSFNLHGYPIVRTAKDALHVFRNSGLEHLQVGEYLVHKAPVEVRG
jgi:carbamoyltransferase